LSVMFGNDRGEVLDTRRIRLTSRFLLGELSVDPTVLASVAIRRRGRTTGGNNDNNRREKRKRATHLLRPSIRPWSRVGSRSVYAIRINRSMQVADGDVAAGVA